MRNAPENAPLISVIIPLYNGASTIRRAITSVLEQYYANWELLVIDDCSSDSSREVVLGFAEQHGDSRIKLLCQERNQGPSAARNRGLKEMQGEAVVFLDCDDELLPQALSTLTSLLEPGIDLVAAAHIAVSGTQQQSRPDRWQGRKSGGETLNAALQGKTWNYLHGKLYRRDLIQKISFPESLFRYEDLVFNACAYSHSSVVLFVEEEVYLYHIQQSSLTWSQIPSLDYIEKSLTGIRNGLSQSASSAVSQVSWDSLKAFFVVMTYSGGIFADKADSANKEVLRYLRSNLSFIQLGKVLFSWPTMAISAALLRVSPGFYRKLYRVHVNRNFGLKRMERT